MKGAFKETYSRRAGQGAEILSIASYEADDASFRIALATFDSRIQVWSINSWFQQKTVFSIQLNMTIPRALTFAPDVSQNVLLFGLDDGHM